MKVTSREARESSGDYHIELNQRNPFNRTESMRETFDSDLKRDRLVRD